jgi:hypothetical protein
MKYFDETDDTETRVGKVFGNFIAAAVVICKIVLSLSPTFR